MRFEYPLIKGKLIKRYKRFLSDILLDNGEIITAHCANSGSMAGLQEAGSTVWVSPAHNPKRKLQYTWELVLVKNNLVGVNTSLPNKIVVEALKEKAISPLKNYTHIQTEVKYGTNSRIDILLTESNLPDCYVEVKSVTLSRKASLAEFPDAITTRGTKHLNELSNEITKGHRAVMIYLIQHENIKNFSIAQDIDPAYHKAFLSATSAGVESYAYSCHISPQAISFNQNILILK